MCPPICFSDEFISRMHFALCWLVWPLTLAWLLLPQRSNYCVDCVFLAPLLALGRIQNSCGRHGRAAPRINMPDAAIARMRRRLHTEPTLRSEPSRSR